MSSLTQIAASIAVPGLSTALQQADLPAGQTIEAKITQIISDEIIRLTSSIGTFDLKASHPSLQPGVSVRLDISQGGHVTLTVLPPKSGAPPVAAPPQPASEAPAVIATLGKPQPAPAPAVYSASGQAMQAGKAPPQPSAPQAQPLEQQGAMTAPISAGTLPAGRQPEMTAAQLPAQLQPQPATSLVPSQTVATPTQTVALPAASAALGEALNRQGGIAPLLANLDQLAKSSKPLPQSLQAAIEDVLQTVQPLSEEVTPQNVRQAVARSGVFYENTLLKLATGEEAAPLSPQTDFKAVLLKLGAALEVLAKGVPPLKNEEALIQRVAAPRAEAPEPQAPREATLSAQLTQQDIAGTLAKQVESALSRVRVLQFASMPASVDAPEAQARPAQSWHVDLPLLLNGQGAIVPLTIEREAASRDAQAMHYRWRLRFALDLNELGAVHALLALGGGLVDVTLWAERRETYDLFKSMTKDLHYALMDEELDVAGVEFRPGHPRTVKSAGGNLDTRT